MQISFKAAKAKRWIIAAVALGSVVTYCAPPGTFRGIDFDLTGTVFDKVSKQPIEGAYVVAIYLVRESGWADRVKLQKDQGNLHEQGRKISFSSRKTR